MGVAVGIALTGGPTGEWTAVYLIERSLSLDNVFLFSLLLAYFLVPPELRGRIIVIGITGAVGGVSHRGSRDAHVQTQASALALNFGAPVPDKTRTT